MRAAVLHSIPGRLTVQDVSISSPLASEVSVRTVAAGLCHSDLRVMEGGLTRPTPAVLGHEAAGVVTEVGGAVTAFRPGDHVALCLSVFCGRCPDCLSGRPYLCSRLDLVQRGPAQEPRLLTDSGGVFAMSGIGALAESILVHENAVVKIADDIPLDVACLLGCAVITGTGAVFNSARVGPGDSVAVIGSGGVGLNCVQASRIAGASPIIAIDTDFSKLALAMQLGATHVLVSSGTDTVDQVRELTGGGVDHAFEVVGLPQLVVDSLRMVKPGGTAFSIGVVADSTQIPILGADLRGGRRLQAVTMGDNRFRMDIPRLLDLYRTGQLQLDELVTNRITLDQVNEGYDLLRTGQGVGRTVVTFRDFAADLEQVPENVPAN